MASPYPSLNSAPSIGPSRAGDPVFQGLVVPGQEGTGLGIEFGLEGVEFVGHGLGVLGGHGKATQEPGTDEQAGPLGGLLEAVEHP